MKFILTLFFLAIFTSFCFTAVCDDAVVLKYTENIRVTEKKCFNTSTLVIQINNPNGDQYSKFYFDYSKMKQLKKISGEITDLNSNIIRKLVNKDIITSSLFSISTFYNDNYLKKFSLKHNQYPYLIKVEVDYETSPFLQITNWDPTWNSDISTLDAELSVSFPIDYELNIDTERIGKPTISITDDEKTMKWKTSYKSVKVENIYSPPLYETIPSVFIVPVKFNYIKPGSFKTWESFGNWSLSIRDGLNVLPDSEKLHIDQLTAGISDPAEMTSILYNYLQDNTRYLNVSIKTGGLLSYPASYVSKNKYGDCKALCNYMEAMLNYKKIKSNTVYVYAGENPPKINARFPSQQFNHVILAVPNEKDTIWLECTSNTLPVNYPGLFTQNRQALWIEPNKSRIITIPPLKTEQVTSINSFHFSEPTPDKKISVQTSFKVKGEDFEELSYFHRNGDAGDQENHIREFFLFKNYSSKQNTITLPYRDSSYIILKAFGSCQLPFSNLGEYLKISLPLLNIPNFEKVNNRTFPVRINSPIATIDTIFYDLNAANYKFGLDSVVTITSNYGKLEMLQTLSGKSLKIIRKIEIPPQYIELENYKSFYDFYLQVNTAGESTILKQIKN